MEGKTTFWDLLDEYSIRIPEIQRDYAQGRDNAVDIRNNFLESIKHSLDSNGEIELDLNFVYGTAKKGGLFTPIDGQQRLTTLYLLHIYILLLLETIDTSTNSRIKKFTYATRDSASRFCEKLSSKYVLGDISVLSSVQKISTVIMNNNWFSSSWKNDPTIRSMLNMLDSIHSLFKDSDVSKYYDILTGREDYDCPIYFYFLDLGNYNLEDSIYIKLNARGKDLTCYENFKAKLSKFISDRIGSPSEDYIARLDGNWSDVFWNFREPETKLYDEKIMNLFINYVINDYAAHMVTTGKDAIRSELTEVIGYSQLEFINRFQRFEDKWDGYKVIQSFINLFELFDLITIGSRQRLFAPGNKYFDEEHLFQWFIESNDNEKADSKTSISYTTRIQADAYLGFILTNKAKIDEDNEFGSHLIDWMRIITTLSRETNYNGSDDYARAISKGVRDMLPHSYEILNYISAINDPSGHGFDSDCFMEECIKAKLILKDNEWRSIILRAEGNEYFNGQIGFLLEATGIVEKYEHEEIETWSCKENDFFISQFKKYLTVFESIFGRFKYNNQEEYVGINREFANDFRRALLCKGDYHLNKSSNSSFLVDVDRDISWKRLLRIQSNDRNDAYKTKRLMILNLINDELFDASDIKTSLNNICNRDSTLISDWRKYFIKIPEIMDSLHNYASYKQKERFVRFEGNSIFLMGSTRFYGFNQEYYSYALYCMIKKDDSFNLEDYLPAKGWEDIHHQIKATDIRNGKCYEIKYERSDNSFKVYSNNNIVSYENAESVLEALEVCN